jgi:hypothetical protein
MNHARAALLAALLLPALTFAAGKKSKDVPPNLPVEHRNPANTLVFRTPTGWTIEGRPGMPEVTEARGDGLIVRIVRRAGEVGLDSLHVECMLVRLAGPMETSPEIEYEYDFVSGAHGERRALDSLFTVHYDAPIDGHDEWKQRNLSIVGGQESVCVIGYAPARTWKKSKEARNLLNAVLGSVEFKQWP